MEENRENETAEEEANAFAPAREGRFDKYLGAYPAFKSLEEINAWVSEMRDDEVRVPDEYSSNSVLGSGVK